jgi:hypothetical protein
MHVNPALELYLRERHRVLISRLPEEPGEAHLMAFLEDVRGRTTGSGPNVYLA